MADYENIRYEVEDGIAIVTIDRPKVLNALNLDTLEELMEAFTVINGDPAIRCAILTGGGEKAFVAGADISQMVGFNSLQGENFAALGQSVLNLIESNAKPVIGAVNGFALGGGTEIAMACDFVYASNKAKFGQPEINLGIIPGFGGTQRLTRLVGKSMAKELVLTGEIISADEALRIGIVNRLCEPDKLMEEAKKTARKISSKGLVALRLAKECIDKGLELDLDKALYLEKQAFAILCSTEDKVEGMKAFLDKRKAEFKDR